jgi:hypothetical protein
VGFVKEKIIVERPKIYATRAGLTAGLHAGFFDGDAAA